MSRVKVKMELEFWYDPETNTYEPISNKVIEDNTKSSSKPSKGKTKDDGSSEPIITLEDNKYILNSRAVETLGVQYEDRLTIQYHKVNGKLVPVIAKDEVLGVKGGNKLTKSNTVACRGKANEKLSEYGSEFKLVEKGEGIYIMEGDKEPTPYKEVDKNINISESEDDHDLEDLDSVDLTADLDSEDAVEITFDDIL